MEDSLRNASNHLETQSTSGGESHNLLIGAVVAIFGNLCISLSFQVISMNIVRYVILFHVWPLQG